MVFEMRRAGMAFIVLLLLGALLGWPAPARACFGVCPKRDKPVVTPSEAAALLESVERGDADDAFFLISAVFEDLGLEPNAELILHLQGPERPISWYNFDAQRIDVTRLLKAGEGVTYWAMWSRLLTGGRWSPDAEIGDAEAQRRLGNFTIMTLLVHELAHHLNHRYKATGATPTLEEYQADTFLIAFLEALAQASPKLRVLRDQYRRVVAGTLLDAIAPEARPHLDPHGDLAEQFGRSLKEVPSSPLGVVALQLTRQRVLFDQRPPPSLRALAAHHQGTARTWTGERSPVGDWSLHTEATKLGSAGDDPTLLPRPGGALYAWPQMDDPQVLLALDPLARPRRIRVLAGSAFQGLSLRRDGATFEGADLLVGFMSDGARFEAKLQGGVAQIEKIAPLPAPPGSKHGFKSYGRDPEGHAWIRVGNIGGNERTLSFFQLVRDKAGPRWASKLRVRREARDAPYVDGPAGSASAHVGPWTVGRDGVLYLLDTKRCAARWLHLGRLETLAGGLCGWRDGTGEAMELTAPFSLTWAARRELLVLDRRGDPHAKNKDTTRVFLRRLREGL